MTNVSSQTASSASNNPDKSNKAILIIGALFFIFGFVTWMNSVLIPYLTLACQLNNTESSLVTFAFYISYFVMAIPSAWLLKKSGFKNGMSFGLAIMAVGALIFIPAALSRTYLLFLIGLFVQGTGLAVLQTASNPYITILGPPESAAKRISIMGICNKVAGAIAPIVLGAIALKDADGLKSRLVSMPATQKITELNELASRVITPYIIIVIILVILAILISFSTLPEINTEHEDETVAAANSRKTSVFQFPHLIIGVFTLFLYVGVEVIGGDYIIKYGSNQGIPFSIAKYLTTGYMIGMLVGYFAGIICIPKYFKQEQALKVLATTGVVFSLIAIFSTGYVSVFSIVLLGLSNSLLWPAIWPLAIAGLGRFTKIGSSFMIMAISGGAIIPVIYSRLADATNPTHAYWILVPCYLFILYYGVKGHTIGLKLSPKIDGKYPIAE